MLRNHFKIILILCMISSLGRFVLDSYLPSLPAIGNHFGISDSRTQLTLTMYLLGFSLSQLIYGPLSDRYGRRIIILVGLYIFLIGSLICALAASPWILLTSRLIAGTGAGACGVLNRAIASDCFKGSDLSKAWSYTTTSLVFMLIIAPVFGGYIQETFGWRANFIVATFFVTTVLIIVLKYLPETHPNPVNTSLKIQHVLFTYFQILTTQSFITSTLCYTLAFAGLIAYFQVSPLLFINVFGLSPSQYGWTSIIIAISYLSGGFFVNKLAQHISAKNMLVIGTCLLISGGLLMLLVNLFHYVDLIAVLAPSAIYVIGARIIIPNAIATSMAEFRHIGGSTSAVIGCVQMFGAALISLLIAEFSYETPLPLAVFMTALGGLSLMMTFFIKNPLRSKT